MKQSGLANAVLVMGVLLGGWALAEGQLTPPEQAAAVAAMLTKEYNLAAPRTGDAQRFKLETRVVNQAEDGTRTGVETYRFDLLCQERDGVEHCVCKKLTVQAGDGPERRIPALEDWGYDLKPGVDGKGQVFGIAHERFDGLKDSEGVALSPGTAYMVYNTFVDFHAFCDVFGRPAAGGRGIQDLHTVGQKIVHCAAFTEAPVNLGTQIGQGSTFKNGEVTLEFKGLSRVDDRPCALVGYDSGDSSFKMLMHPSPQVEVQTRGSSHYWGDIYLDLASMWPRRVTMAEVVVSLVTMGQQKVANSVVQRATTIRLVDAF